ncbi:MAG: PrsW family glutamic-type intramembrane protease [Candidatus Paceibacterota bacterium]|jgi:RsiW-degrading membrane proteinase PrsW (M82 family)
MLTGDPKILSIAFLGGIIPSLLWLWFWVKKEEKEPEPKIILLMIFLMGMVAVVFVLPIQKFIQENIGSREFQIILWAGAEEMIKYLAVMIILFKATRVHEPIDWPIYMITAALGFAALENALFLKQSLSLDQTTVGLFTAASIGQLRFLGSTLLHAVSSGILGIGLGISIYMTKFKRKLYIFIGLVLAIALHSVFNFFIMKIRLDDGNGFLEILKVFAFLWVVTIIVMLLFEKIRRMN